MGRISRSFQLLQASRQVFTINPSLVWYPFVALASFLSTLILVIAPLSAGGAYLAYRLGYLTEANAESFFDSPYLAIVGVLFVFALQLVTIFVNTAFYIAAEAALNGEKMRMRLAFSKAWTHRKRLAQWAIVGTLVGVILNIIHEKAGWAGKFISIIGNIAWTMATIFIIPTLVTHDMGPIDSLKHSAGLFKRTWGENVVAQFSLGLISLFAVLAIILFPGAILMILVAGAPIVTWMIVTEVLIKLSLLFALIAYTSSLQIIFNAALYRYAETGDYIGPFSQEMISGAYHSKK
ncbi:MAG TPA: DUF6159 family protein [Verrucomicrobiae bacterium]|nr:DUF6159 family protein [Verrucomicrobiae bacterium]